jgi:hypothetical protein
MQFLRFIPLRRAAALCAVVMAASIAARGQSGFLYAASLHASPAPSNALALKFSPAASLSLASIPRPTLQYRAVSLDAKTLRISVEQAAFTQAHVSTSSQSLVSKIAASCQESKTPFLDQIQIPLLHAVGGRLQLGGFGNNTSMQNVLWGPSDSGSASVRSFRSSAHSGARFPSDNESYGLSLRLRLSATSSELYGGGVRKGLRAAAKAIIGHAFARY